MTTGPDLAALRARVTWHEYRAWRAGGVDRDGSPVVPPCPDACGDCGRLEGEHPIPLLRLSPEAAARLVLGEKGGKG